MINGKVTEPVFAEPIQLILLISEVMRGSEKKKEVDLTQSLVATLPKNSYSSKKKLQPFPLKLQYISSLKLVEIFRLDIKFKLIHFILAA